MQQPRLSVSQAVGVVLGVVIFEAIRRQLRADTWDYGQPGTASGEPANRTAASASLDREGAGAASESAAPGRLADAPG